LPGIDCADENPLGPQVCVKAESNHVSGKCQEPEDRCGFPALAATAARFRPSKTRPAEAGCGLISWRNC